jgi:superfamily II DNA or RNA helicase
VSTYDQYIAGKSDSVRFPGLTPRDAASHLFPFQKAIVEWALRKGRAANFSDTGLGKTIMQVEWARQVSAEGRVLMLAPLAVADQTSREGARFGVDIPYCREDIGARICITNYEMLDRFDPDDFIGIVLDESSILKNFTGKMRNGLINAFSNTPYRFACTATPAPNDFTELGNHSEFLGALSRVEMLAEYFVHDGGSTQDWRLKGHAVESFWRWVCTWGVVVRSPDDLGFDGGGFKLPPLHIHQERIRVDHSDAHQSGMLFQPDARTLNEQRRVRKATLDERVAIAVRLAEERPHEPLLIWCEYNREADAVEAAIADAVQIQGSDAPEVKRDRLMSFTDGRIRVLVTKPSIAGFGLNWQHCNRMMFFGPSHSYEQTYQAIRRCWRFGQERQVHVHIATADNEQAVVQNYRRKEADAARLGAEVVSHTQEHMMEALGLATSRSWNPYNPNQPMRLPEWMVSQ